MEIRDEGISGARGWRGDFIGKWYPSRIHVNLSAAVSSLISEQGEAKLTCPGLML